MPYIALHNQTDCGLVSIPARFIDYYMAPAAGEYVKVYLCLLRCLTGGTSCSVAGLAEQLRHTEGDVLRALHYWEEQGLVRLQFDSRRELTDVSLLPVPSKGGEIPLPHMPAPAKTRESGVSEPSSAGKRETAAGLSPAELADLGSDNGFQEFLMIAQHYLGRTLKPSDCDRFGYWYQLFGRSADLLVFLVEYCVENGHTSLHYMEKVALNWHQSGVTNVSEAKEYTDARSSAVHAAMSAFGLKDRAPGVPEQDFIRRWQNVYGFSSEMIGLACGKTISAIHKPSFEYADKILSSWKEQGAFTPEAAAALDSKRRGSKKQAAEPATGRGAAGNRFHNFDQRQYDYDALEDQIYKY